MPQIFKQRWFIKDFERQTLNPEIERRMDATGMIVRDEIKRTITDKGLIKTGLYRDTITFEKFMARLAVRIGSPITDPPYPLFLELGTSRGIPAHAPMRIGLANSASRLRAIW